MAETLREAKAHGWRITARGGLGKQVGMHRFRECVARYELDLDTLIWTRGAEFPLSMLAERLKCPRCGSRRVVLLFNRPSEPSSKRAG
jgi:DNA-directed RNA polymerase subunit RPC12/RpoP